MNNRGFGRTIRFSGSAPEHAGKVVRFLGRRFGRSKSFAVVFFEHLSEQKIMFFPSDYFDKNSVNTMGNLDEIDKFESPPRLSQEENYIFLNLGNSHIPGFGAF